MTHNVEVNIAELSSFKNEGVVDHVWTVETPKDLKEFCEKNHAFFVLGKGSNTLINPHGKTKNFLRISPEFSPIEINKSLLTVSAGVSIQKLLQICQKLGLSGLEFTAGVPASVGGMVFMNFGCWGKSVSDVIQQVRIFTQEGQDMWLLNSELKFGYRKSVFHQISHIILAVQFTLEKSNPEKVKNNIDSAIQDRLAKQPLREKTFGSIFKNPPGQFAAKLIESCGLKGREFNGIKISDRHANFLVNLGAANYEDITSVLTLIQNEIKTKCGLDLELEVRITP